MFIYGRKSESPDGSYKPIKAEVLDPTWSVVFFYLYPAVVAGFLHLNDAINFCDTVAETYGETGCWSVIQTGDLY